MSEQSPPIKSPDLSNLPRGAISIKGLPLSRNTRLPSIRSPRDLTLGAQPKRVFTPNIPVRREKKTSVPSTEQSQISSENVNKASKKGPCISPRGKKGPRNVIQTEGSLFGEGIAPSTSKNDKQRESTPRFSSRKPIVKKEFDMSDVNSGIDLILRDDFIDDGEDDDDDEKEDIKPVIYPWQDSAEKSVKKEVIKKKSFDDNNFAQEMGFDVDKIASFIKKEKGTEEAAPSHVAVPADSKNEFLDHFKSDDQQMFLLQFPKAFDIQQPEDQPRDSPPNASSKVKTGLASLPEGPIGKLQFLKSGRVRLVVGENHFYLNCEKKALKTKHEVVSVRTDSDNSDMIVLGNIEHKLTFTPDVDKLIRIPR